MSIKLVASDLDGTMVGDNNIISNSNDQLILSPSINKEANINIEHQEQNTKASNNINTVSYQDQQYIHTSNEIIPSSTQEIAVNNNQQEIKSQNIFSQNVKVLKNYGLLY